MKNIHGTCSLCGGVVTTPQMWGGTYPPVPTCDKCGATIQKPRGDVLPMERPDPPPIPREPGSTFGGFRDMGQLLGKIDYD